MFYLLGDAPEITKDESRAVMRIETALAKGSMSRVEPAQSAERLSQNDSRAAEALSPRFDWNVYFEKIGLPHVASLNVADPGFFKAMNAELQKEKLAGWKAYLTGIWRMQMRLIFRRIL